MPSYAPLERYEQHLFQTEEEMRAAGLLQDTIEHILRLRDLYAYWRNFPQMTQDEMVLWAQSHQDVRRSAAYADTKIVKALIGDMERENRGWQRFLFNQRCEKIYQKAMDADDLKMAQRALADWAKYNRLDQPDDRETDFGDIKPHHIEPTDDPTVIGIEPVADLRRRIRQLKQKLGADISDADFTEIEETKQ